ncbi:MAG: hypothetical protein M3Q48_04865 [Actinomycetota bacterium]|nr:hypothetical protein [Actinomycetota bacterium]
MDADEGVDTAGGGAGDAGGVGAGSDAADAPRRDAAEARADELGDLAAIQADPGPGVTDAEPGAATVKHAATGASTGTGPLGLGTLDEGASSQVTGATEPSGEEGERAS